MRVAVTGTPGTGKTTATRLVDSDLTVIHLNDIIVSEQLYTRRDADRDSLVADFTAIEQWLDGKEDIIIESHLAHYFDADRVVVLRCAPHLLFERLTTRGEPGTSAEENSQSEAIDGILVEAVNRHGHEKVFEIDTTDRSPADTANEIEHVIVGNRPPSAGDVDFTDYL